jgi:hypothetical protein
MESATTTQTIVWCSTQDTSNGAFTTVKSDLSLGHSTKCEYGSKLHEGNVHHHAMILLCCHGTTAMVLNQLPRHYYQASRRDK